MAPRPLQTGQALKMVQNSPKINPGDQFKCHIVSFCVPPSKTKILSVSRSSTQMPACCGLRAAKPSARAKSTCNGRPAASAGEWLFNVDHYYQVLFSSVVRRPRREGGSHSLLLLWTIAGSKTKILKSVQDRYLEKAQCTPAAIECAMKPLSRPQA